MKKYDKHVWCVCICYQNDYTYLGSIYTSKLSLCCTVIQRVQITRAGMIFIGQV